MNMIKPLTRLGFYLAVAVSPWVAAEPVLNGIAASVELNKDRFIAGLYASTPSTSAEDLLRNDIERRMELRITADRLSAKGLNNMWIEGMAINNASGALRDESESLSKLVNMIRKSVVRGDTLVFDARPGDGMTVTLNGTQLGTIASENFFSMVLRTWIGNVPLSSDFKQHLLAAGKIDDELRDRFTALSPTNERIAAVQTWAVPTPPPEPQPAQQVAIATPTTPPRPQVEISRPVIEVPASETIEALRRQNPDQVANSLPNNRSNQNPATPAQGQANNGANNNSRPTGNTNGNQRPADNSNSRNNGSETAAATNPGTNAGSAPTQAANQAANAQPTQVAVAVPKVPAQQATDNQRPATATPSATANEGLAEEEEEEFISAAAIFDRQVYISNVLKKAWAAVEYPDRALRREQEGTVRIAVTVDKSGKLIDTVPVEESRFGLLNREAIATFDRAQPFAPFPPSITEDTISFTIPVTFEIRR